MTEPTPTRRSRLGSVRVRTTVGAVMVVGVALVVAAVAIVAGLRDAALDRLSEAAAARADDLAAAIDSGTDPTAVAVDDVDDRFVQVVATDGTVLVASPIVSALGALDDRAGRRVTLATDDDTDDWLVVVAPPRHPDVRSVVVGRERDATDDSVSTATALLATAIPVLMAIVGATTWMVVGRALAPVEAVRRRAEAIGPDQLDHRLPVPDTDDEISRLTVTLNTMLGRLEASHRQQRRFISDAGHELRSPIATLRQHAAVAEAQRVAHDGDATDDDETLAEVVSAETDRLGNVVDDLILLARADEGALGGRRVPVDLDDLVLDEVRRLPDTIRIDASAVSGGQVIGDPAQLARAVRNVVANAVNHASGQIAVGVRESDDGVTVWVDDDGPGIPSDDRARVFERFVRLDEARSRDAGGTGLGLAIVAEVMANHRGAATVEDSPLGGTRVSLRFPG